MGRGISICIAAFAVAVMLLFPVRAWAAKGDYTIDELSTSVTVETNAMVRIIEQQTLTFDESNTGVTWYLHTPGNAESVRIESVRVAPVDHGGALLGDWTRLQMIDSNPNKQGRKPGDKAAAPLLSASVQPWFSYNIGDGMIRCYFPIGKDALVSSVSSMNRDRVSANTDTAQDAGLYTYTLETTYTIAHRVLVYRDVAELYWRYLNETVPVDPRNISLQILLPIPAEADPLEASKQIRAWGHGPYEGTFTVGDNGSITYHIEQAQRGNYAEAHVIFPASWMSNMTGSANQFSWLRGPSVMQEESGWVDIGMREAVWDNKVRVLFLGLTLIVLLFAAIKVAYHGRSHRSVLVLIRTAATLGIMALTVQLFFQEPVTFCSLAVLALILAAISFTLSSTGSQEEDKSTKLLSSEGDLEDSEELVVGADD